MAYGMTNFRRNKQADYFHRGQAYAPPSLLYMALVTTTPSASAAGSEVTGSGYSRIAVPQDLVTWSGTQGVGSTAVSSGTSGIIVNNIEIDFGTAGGAWGTVSHWEFWDALTGGIRHYYGEVTNDAGLAAPRSIVNGDPVKFPIGSVQFQW